MRFLGISARSLFSLPRSRMSLLVPVVMDTKWTPEVRARLGVRIWAAKRGGTFSGVDSSLAESPKKKGRRRAASPCEQHDWGRFGKLRREWERQFEDPDDVYLKAKQREEDRRKLGLPPRLGIIPHSAVAGEEERLEAEQRRKKKLTGKGRG